ncbi:MAG: Ig-like domain-containing protein, partial [bacterium]|nr:Ig-like domain-containing protein [bacterium]
WSQINGPAEAKFTDTTALTPSVLFALNGIYTLRLTADDGEFQTSDDVAITVPKVFLMSQAVDTDEVTLENIENFKDELTRIKDELGIRIIGQSFPTDSSPDIWTAYLNAVNEQGFKIIPWFEDSPPIWNNSTGLWELGVNEQFLDFLDTYDLQTHTHPALYAFFLIDEPFHEKHGKDADGNLLVTTERMQTLYALAKTIAPHVPIFVNFSAEIKVGETTPNKSTDDFKASMTDIVGIGGLEFRQNLDEVPEPTFERLDLINNNDLSRIVVARETEPDAPIISSVQTFGGDTMTYYMPSPPELTEELDILRCPQAIYSTCPTELTDHINLTGLNFRSWSGSGDTLLDDEFSLARAVVKKAVTGQDGPTVDAGTDQDIALPLAATLSGTATDDGLPTSPGALTTVWSTIDTPIDGVVTVENPNSPQTTGTFSKKGVYTLRLTAYDGMLTTFDDITFTASDSIYPTAEITVSPLYGLSSNVVTGVVQVLAVGTDNAGVTKLEFRVDGETVETIENSQIHTFQWNTAGYAEGIGHTLTVKAYDASGNSSVSSGKWVKVSNDTPTITITSPDEENTTVSGTSFTFIADAGDSGGIDRVELFSDTTLLDADTASPYQEPWDTTTVSDGTHTLTATAYDITLKSTITMRQVVVDNADPDTAMITNLTGGQVVSGTYTVQGAASDGIGLDYVELFVDGETIGSMTYGSTYEYLWDTQNVLDGNHNLKIRAYDMAGNSTISDIVTVWVGNETVSPTTLITSPLGGTVVRRGKVVITATAVDTVGVTRVEFLVNGTVRCTDWNFSYSCNWYETRTSGAQYILTTRAYDKAGNIGESPPITVTAL